jgi:hypothetical protein
VLVISSKTFLDLSRTRAACIVAPPCIPMVGSGRYKRQFQVAGNSSRRTMLTVAMDLQVISSSILSSCTNGSLRGFPNSKHRLATRGSLVPARSGYETANPAMICGHCIASERLLSHVPCCDRRRRLRFTIAWRNLSSGGVIRRAGGRSHTVSSSIETFQTFVGGMWRRCTVLGEPRARHTHNLARQTA